MCFPVEKAVDQICRGLLARFGPAKSGVAMTRHEVVDAVTKTAGQILRPAEQRPRRAQSRGDEQRGVARGRDLAV